MKTGRGHVGASSGYYEWNGWMYPHVALRGGGGACVNSADFLFAGRVATRHLSMRIRRGRHRDMPSIPDVRSAPPILNGGPECEADPIQLSLLATLPSCHGRRPGGMWSRDEARRSAIASFSAHRYLAQVVVVSLRTWGWRVVCGGIISPVGRTVEHLAPQSIL